MDPRNLYTLRYREGFGVQTGLIVASTPAKADEIGKKWCNSRVNCRFIRTERTVLADESILEQPVRDGEVVKPEEAPATTASASPAVLKAQAAATGGVRQPKAS